MPAERPYLRQFRLTLVALVAVLPLLVYGAFRSMQSMYTSPVDWVPPSYTERQQYEWFVEHFEREETVVVSWPGCKVNDSRIDTLSDALAATAVHDAGKPLFDRVLSGRSVLRTLVSEPLNLPPNDAVNRLRGSLLGKGGRMTCVVVVLTDAGAARRQKAIETICDTAVNHAGLERDELRVAGPPVWAATIDQASIASVYWYTAPSVLVSFFLCWLCLRSVRYTLVIVVTAAIGEVAVLSLVWLTGGTMNAVLIVMPALVFVLVVSAGVHLTNYYVDDVRLRGRRGSTRRAMRIGRLPCALAVVTTVIGLGSLLVSDSVPIKQFGVFSSVALVVTVGVAFLVLPGAMQRWPAASGWCAPNNSGDNDSHTSHRGGALWNTLHDLVWRYGTFVAIACLSVVALSAPGLFRLTTTADVLALLSPRSPAMRDVAWFRENVVPLVTVEALLHVDDKCTLNSLQRLEMMRDIQQRLQTMNSVSGSISAATFAPKIPAAGLPGKMLLRSQMNSHLEQDLGRFVDLKYLAQYDGRQTWRISVRVFAPENTQYSNLIQAVHREIDQAIAGYTHGDATGIQVNLTGGMPLADSAHRALLRDLCISFATALVFVTVVMIVILRSAAAGLAAMIPNVFPVAIVFGVMGWTGRPVDIGTVMTASIALGIAVDGTLHFLTWFRRETAAGLEHHEAVRKCLLHCGNAIVQTTLICGLGLLVFALSDFVPTRQFAWMMLMLLLVALAGDLILLPSLLVGPIGKLFVGKPVAANNQDD